MRVHAWSVASKSGSEAQRRFAPTRPQGQSAAESRHGVRSSSLRSARVTAEQDTAQGSSRRRPATTAAQPPVRPYFSAPGFAGNKQQRPARGASPHSGGGSRRRRRRPSCETALRQSQPSAAGPGAGQADTALLPGCGNGPKKVVIARGGGCVFARVTWRRHARGGGRFFSSPSRSHFEREAPCLSFTTHQLRAARRPSSWRTAKAWRTSTSKSWTSGRTRRAAARHAPGAMCISRLHRGARRHAGRHIAVHDDASLPASSRTRGP